MTETGSSGSASATGGGSTGGSTGPSADSTGGGSSATPTPTVPTVGFLAASGIFGEGDLGAPILLTLSAAVAGEVRVPVIVGASSSATMGTDFQLVDTEAVFPAGQTTATVRVDFLADAECEGDEVLRLLDSCQLTANEQVATPANWKQGEDVIVVPSVSDEDANAKYGSFDAKLPYLRYVKQPG